MTQLLVVTGPVNLITPQFLVLLSYEKYHSKSIITMARIIQLCDELMASGQDPSTHAIPALQPIVNDLFVVRRPAKEEVCLSAK